VKKQEETMAKDLASTQTSLESKIVQLSGTITTLSARVEDKALELADQCMKSNTLKRNVEEGVRSAVNERCERTEEFARSALDTLLAEVGTRLEASARGTKHLHAKFADFETTLEFVRNHATERNDQVEAALAATERLASAARKEAESAVHKSESVESIIMTILQPELNVTSRSKDASEIFNESQDSVRGSGRDAVRQLRAQTPRLPTKA
jgi:hypothetical protein